MSEADRHRGLVAALGRVPSGLFVLTARHDTLETGMLASWVQQCSFEPPQLTVAINRARALSDWLREGASFTVNILDASQTDMIVHFGRGFALNEPAFTGLQVERPDGAAPVLSEALAFLECRVVGRFAAGDHDLILGQIVEGKLLGDGPPMVHIRKSGANY